MRAVERSGECRAQENVSACYGEDVGAKPHPHNPRKQRRNPAGAGSGEHFRRCKWRRRRDSNPRDGSPSAPLAGVCLRPLGHVSADPYMDQAPWKQGVSDRTDVFVERPGPRVTRTPAADAFCEFPGLRFGVSADGTAPGFVVAASGFGIASHRRAERVAHRSGSPVFSELTSERRKPRSPA